MACPPAFLLGAGPASPESPRREPKRGGQGVGKERVLFPAAPVTR